MGVAIRTSNLALVKLELELEIIQTQMTHKPVLRAEVYVRALRASQNRKEDSVYRAGSIILPPPSKVETAAWRWCSIS